MGMVGRKYALGGSSYRYSINGQEKSNELSEGLTTALYWEYDSRIGRRWNVDPVSKVGESPYSCFSNNPVLRIDINGDSDSSKNNMMNTTVGSVSKVLSFTPPKFSLRIGDAFGPVGKNKATSIFQLYGGTGSPFYNSPIRGRLNSLTESNHFIQGQWLFNTFQLGFNFFKQKSGPFANGYRIEAPSALELSVGTNRNLLTYEKLELSTNISFSAGPTLGFPTFAGGTNANVNLGGFHIPTGGDDYYIVGLGASLIVRLDVTYNKRISTFIAGTIHHLQTFDQSTSLGTQEGFVSGSASITSGVGYNITGSRCISKTKNENNHGF